MSSAELDTLFKNPFGFKPFPAMLIGEQEELEKGERKRSNNYTCYCCGKNTFAQVMSDRRKLYLCATCFKGRCDFCDGEWALTIVAQGKIGRRHLRICKVCDEKENHSRIDNLLKCSKQEYSDFKNKVVARRQKVLDAMNKAIEEGE